MSGFICFTQPIPETPLTMRQRVVNLSDERRKALLMYFINKESALSASRDLGINRHLVGYVFDKIDEIQMRCRVYMRAEVILTPAVYNNGVLVTPVVMNTPPATAAVLRDTVRPEFTDDFPVAFFANVVTEMINWCKYDGSGTWAFYKAEIVK